MVPRPSGHWLFFSRDHTLRVFCKLQSGLHVCCISNCQKGAGIGVASKVSIFFICLSLVHTLPCQHMSHLDSRDQTSIRHLRFDRTSQNNLADIYTLCRLLNQSRCLHYYMGSRNSRQYLSRDNEAVRRWSV